MGLQSEQFQVNLLELKGIIVTQHRFSLYH